MPVESMSKMLIFMADIEAEHMIDEKSGIENNVICQAAGAEYKPYDGICNEYR